MLERWADRLTRSGIPDPRRLVMGRRHYVLVIRTKLGKINIALMFERDADWLTRSGIPDSCRLVVRGRHHALAIWAELGRINIALMLETFERNAD